MNYKKIYDQLIEHAQHSPRPQETSEEHHIVPRCMGGSEEASNKVYLSAHEHIWAHIWLAQIYPGVFGVQLAVSMMVFGDNGNLGRYPTEEQVCDSVATRERAREQNRGENHPMFGKSHSEETKQKLSEALSGKSHSEETKQKISEAQSGENCHWFGALPWLNPKTLRSPKSLQVWFHADSYFDLWKEHRCSYARLAKLFGVSWGTTHRSLVVKFRDGWVPNEDTEWLKFKEQE